MPFDQASYKKPKRAKAKKKAKKRPAKKAKKKAKKKVAKKKAKRLPVAKAKVSYPRSGGSQGLEKVKGRVPYGELPSPARIKRPRSCYKEGGSQMPDPKADAHAIREAVANVGSPKDKLSFPAKGAYLTVAYGVGVDSTAILIGLNQLWKSTRQGCWVPRAITFADTGGEKPSTYAYIHRINKWLKSAFRGAPRWAARKVTVVSWTTEHLAKGYGTASTLEQSELLKQTYPSIAYGRTGCSAKFKVEPQEAWLLRQIEAGKLPPIPKGKRLVRAIGYDSTETDRRKGAGGSYASAKEEEKGFRGWYPLMEWGWDRARCIAEIAVQFGSKASPNWKAVPQKSSCTFCSAMKAEEIVMLGEDYPHLLERALFMEHVGRVGRGKKAGKNGLGKAFFWADFVTANFNKLPHRQRVVIWGGVVRDNPKQQTTLFVGDPRDYPRELGPRDRIVPACGRIMSPRELARIQAKAENWIRAVKGVKKGTEDLSLHPATKSVPAFTDVQGFRGCPRTMTWDRAGDVLIPKSEQGVAKAKARLAKTRDEDVAARSEAEIVREEQRLQAYDVAAERADRSAKKHRLCRNPPRGPVYPRSPMLDPGAMLNPPWRW
jgi:hypothetical protein